MEILYLYITKFKNITEQGFNLSPNFDFEYDKLSRTLKVTTKDNNPPSLFNSKYANITAVIGENGSGKSSFLELLRLLNGSQYENRLDFILCYRQKENEKIFVKKSIEFEIRVDSNDTEYEFEYIEPEVSLKKSYRCYYFSTVKGLDEKEQKLTDSTTVDVSQWRNNEKHSVLQFQEVSRNAFFIANFPDWTKNNLSFTPPDYLQISVKSNFTHEINSAQLSFKLSENLKFLLRKFFPANDPIYNTFYGKFYEKIFINELHAAGSMYDELFSYFKSYNFVDHVKLIDDLFEKKYGQDSNPDIPNLKPLISFFKKFENAQVDSSEEREMIYGEEPSPDYNAIRIPTKQKDHLKELVDAVGSIKRKIPLPFEYEWKYKDSDNNGSLSTGQQVFLGLISRFYMLRGELVHGPNLIQLDEPNLSLHPNWEKKLIHFLNNDFADMVLKNLEDRSVQLILTSHSPFILSDMPKQNVIFLKRDQSGFCNVDKGMERKQTFAGNIHTLLKDGFFLEGGTIGDFAKEFVEKIINDIKGFPEENQLNLRKKGWDKVEEIYKCIDLISEPIIQSKLKEAFDNKLDKYPEYLIQVLEKRIEKLKDKNSKT